MKIKRKFFAILIALCLILSMHSTLLATAFSTDNDMPAENQQNEDPAFTVEDRDVDTGYLLRENFPKSFRSGQTWERVNISHGSNGETSIIEKDQRLFPAYMKKSFVPQNGIFTVEFKSIMIDNIGKGFYSLFGEDQEGNEVEGIRFSIINNAVYYLDGNGDGVQVTTLSSGLFRGFKLVIDVSKQTLNIFIDGVAVTESVGEESQPRVFKFSKPVEKLSSISFGIEANSLGCMQMGTCYIYKGYAIHEDLISAGTGSSFNPNINFAKGKDIRATALNQKVMNNMQKAPLAVDGDPATYWEHDSQYTAHEAYLIVELGTIHTVDTIKITFNEPYKGKMSINHQTSVGTWPAIDQLWYFRQYDINESSDELIEDPSGSGAYVKIKGLTLEVHAAVPAFAKSIGLGFFKYDDTVDKEDFKSIEVAEVEAYCQADLIGEVPSFPSDWERTAAPDTQATADDFYGYTAENEFNVFKLSDASATGGVKISKDFEKEMDDASLKAQYKFMVEDPSELTGGFQVRYTRESGQYLAFYTKGSDLYFGSFKSEGVLSQEVKVKELVDNIFYLTVLSYNEKTNTCEIVINGWNPVEDITLSSDFVLSGDKFVKMEIFTGNETQGTFYVDEIKAFERPADTTVPEPVPLDTGDTMLTMQACTLWREGTHQGWAALNVPSMYYRKPILGWYDEGNTEVADWEIKIAAEHGISNFMYCWYHATTPSGPILKAHLEGQLWEGVFNSEYRDYFKFSMMYTNGVGYQVAKSYDEFMNDYWTYFIEVYFKNPNYAKTNNNEPIFYIYDYQNFINNLGDISGENCDGKPDGKQDYNDSAYAIKMMRQKCVEAGFNGLYIAAEYRGEDATRVKNIGKSGFDAVFAYTWHIGEYNQSNDVVLANTQSSMMKQRAAITSDEALADTDFQIIPNISKSWDPRGWNQWGYQEKSASYYYDLEHYRQFALWTRDVFGGATMGNGQQMIMLDNWNEYSEGHWLFPTYGTPSYKGGKYTYGYLDVLREVFGLDPYEHTDHLPLEEGYGPYDTWFPDGWGQPADSYEDYYGEIVVDNSVRRDDIVDALIGYNTTGGSVAFDAEAVEQNDKFVITVTDCARLRLSEEVIKSIQSSGKGLQVVMKVGSVEISKEELAKINGKFDIVFKELLVCSEIYDRINAEDDVDYELYQSTVYNLETLVNGFNQDMNVKVSLNANGADGVAAVKTQIENKVVEGDVFVFECVTNADLAMLKYFN